MTPSGIRRRRLQAAPFRVSPLIQLILFHWREFRARMYECISAWRHLAAPNGRADSAQQLLLLLDCVFPPARKIHPVPGLRDIALYQPRHRLDIAIPLPFGLFGVTVLAGSLHDGEDEWIDASAGQ